MIDYELLKLKLEDSSQYAINFYEGSQVQAGIDLSATSRDKEAGPILSDRSGAFGLPAKVSEDDLSIQLKKEVDEIYSAARQHFEKGHLNEAVSLWEKVDLLAPGYKSVREYLVEAYTFAGANLYAQKRREEALAVWNKVVRLDPNNTEVQGYIKRTKNEINKLKALSYGE
jgi:tetratricopeptide (TPR) repeat protein